MVFQGVSMWPAQTQLSNHHRSIFHSLDTLFKRIVISKIVVKNILRRKFLVALFWKIVHYCESYWRILWMGWRKNGLCLWLNNLTAAIILVTALSTQLFLKENSVVEVVDSRVPNLERNFIEKFLAKKITIQRKVFGALNWWLLFEQSEFQPK